MGRTGIYKPWVNALDCLLEHADEYNRVQRYLIYSKTKLLLMEAEGITVEHLLDNGFLRVYLKLLLVNVDQFDKDELDDGLFVYALFVRATAADREREINDFEQAVTTYIKTGKNVGWQLSMLTSMVQA